MGVVGTPATAQGKPQRRQARSRRRLNQAHLLGRPCRFYAPQLFESLGSASSAALLNAVVIGAVNVGSTVVSILCVDRFGRRALFLGACTGSACSGSGWMCPVQHGCGGGARLLDSASLPAGLGQQQGWAGDCKHRNLTPATCACCPAEGGIQMIAAEIVVGVLVPISVANSANTQVSHAAAAAHSATPPLPPAGWRHGRAWSLLPASVAQGILVTAWSPWDPGHPLQVAQAILAFICIYVAGFAWSW